MQFIARHIDEAGNDRKDFKTLAMVPLSIVRVRVPQCLRSVKGKGFAAVLTRSILITLHFIPVRCGFRAAP